MGRKKKKPWRRAVPWIGQNVPYDPKSTSYQILTKIILPCFKSELREYESGADWPIARMLSIWFNETSRRTYFARAKRNFTLRGKYWVAARKWSNIAGPRRIKVGTLLIITEDDTMPNRIDMDVVLPADKEVPETDPIPEHVFTLTKAQFIGIKDNIETSKLVKKDVRHLEDGGQDVRTRSAGNAGSDEPGSNDE